MRAALRGGLTRRTVVGGGLLALLMSAAFTVVLLAIEELRRSTVLARHSEAVLAAANQLERLVIDVETGQRGFVITGDERFLEPWNNARQSFPGQAGALERLAAARSVEQGRRAAQIAQSGESYIRDYSVPTVDGARHDRASALTVAVTQEGRRRIDGLRAEFDRFGSFEETLSATRQERSQAAAGRAAVAAATGVAGSVLVVLVATGYLTRTIVRPVRRTAAMAGRLAAGDLRVRLPESGVAEIGRLERAFNTLGDSLETSDRELRLIVEEQAALRRVATLVARAVPPAEVFCAVCDEVARRLDAPVTWLLRAEPDGSATVMAGRGEFNDELSVGARVELDPVGVVAAVVTGHAAQQEKLDRVLGSLVIRSALAGPVVVEGRLWGVMVAGWRDSARLASGAERRLVQFTELVATAIANAESRLDLAASRARLVAASDEARRRIERDLHDGTQQRLVSLALDLRAAEASMPSDLIEVKAQLSRTADGMAAAVEELQEVSRGIHPAILSRSGLEAALKALARRSPVPVGLVVSAERAAPDTVQVAVYYVVSEALTNVAKHARATMVRVHVAEEEGMLRLSIIDDGVGGAKAGTGSGLIGLRDRIEALGGRIDIASAAGKGTALHVAIPVA